jgi:hypothetical protein
VVSAHVEWLVEASRESLRRVDEALGPRPDTLPVGTPGAFDAAVAGLPGQVVVWVFDAKGDSVLTNDPLAAGVNVAARPITASRTTRGPSPRWCISSRERRKARR